MKSSFHRFVDKYGWEAVVMTLLSPLLLPIIMPYYLLKTLKNLIVSVRWRQSSFWSGNTVSTACTHYFYYVQDLNIRKFGRHGTSSFMGGGGYPLSKLVHLSPISLRLQASLGTSLLLLFCGIGWILAAVLSASSLTMYSFGVIVLSIFSTLFFVNFVDLQNYNAVGWMLFPSVVHAVMFGSPVLLAVLILLISMVSFTATIIAFVITLVSAVYTGKYVMIGSVIPAAIMLLFPLAISTKDQGMREIAGAIGLTRDVKYVRKGYSAFSAADVYFSVVWIALPSTYASIRDVDQSFILLCLPLILYFVNQKIVRFADYQSIYLTALTIFTVVILRSGESLVLIAAYIASINPAYGFIGLLPVGRRFFQPRIRLPFNSETMVGELDRLLADVPEGSRVLIAFENPQNDYCRIFDGYHMLIEPLSYVAHRRNIIIFPDWYFVFKNNKSYSPDDYWGRSPYTVSRTLSRYSADYVIVYQKTEMLDPEWRVAGFQAVAAMNWNKVFHERAEEIAIKDAYWWILQRRDKRAA